MFQDSYSPNKFLLATLSMEVSYTFHSFLIGKSGQHIIELMNQTKTRINFPDHNRIADHPKSSKIVIRGEMENIENARQRIRKKVPVEFSIDCRLDQVNKFRGDMSLMDYFSAWFGVSLRFYPLIDGVTCQVTIRGQHDRIDKLKEAVVEFCNTSQTILDDVVMRFVTSFDHVWYIHTLIDQIINKSGAAISLPNYSGEHSKKHCIWITGTMDAVYTASVLLTGLLPLELTFQVESNQMISNLIKVANKEDILFHSETLGPGYVTVRLTSYEKNVGKMYQLASMCWNLPKTCTVCPIIPIQWSQWEKRNSFLSSHDGYQLSTLNHSLPTVSRRCSYSLVDVTAPPSPSILSATSSWSPKIEPPPFIPSFTVRFDPISFHQLELLLESKGLSNYTNLFLVNDIDLVMFSTMTDQDLVSIGINSFGARKIMLLAIQALNPVQ